MPNSTSADTNSSSVIFNQLTITLSQFRQNILLLRNDANKLKVEQAECEVYYNDATLIENSEIENLQKDLRGRLFSNGSLHSNGTTIATKVTLNALKVLGVYEGVPVFPFGNSQFELANKKNLASEQVKAPQVGAKPFSLAKLQHAFRGNAQHHYTFTNEKYASQAASANVENTNLVCNYDNNPVCMTALITNKKVKDGSALFVDYDSETDALQLFFTWITSPKKYRSTLLSKYWMDAGEDAVPFNFQGNPYNHRTYCPFIIYFKLSAAYSLFIPNLVAAMLLDDDPDTQLLGYRMWNSYLDAYDLKDLDMQNKLESYGDSIKTMLLIRGYEFPRVPKDLIDKIKVKNKSIDFRNNVYTHVKNGFSTVIFVMFMDVFLSGKSYNHAIIAVLAYLLMLLTNQLKEYDLNYRVRLPHQGGKPDDGYFFEYGKNFDGSSGVRIKFDFYSDKSANNQPAPGFVKPCLSFLGFK